jgi:hypothetical protein
MYELMCTFFFSCHTYTLASEPQLEQPSWLIFLGQFSQKKVWLIVVIYGDFVMVNGGVRQLLQLLEPSSFNAHTSL